MLISKKNVLTYELCAYFVLELNFSDQILDLHKKNLSVVTKLKCVDFDFENMEFKIKVFILIVDKNL